MTPLCVNGGGAGSILRLASVPVVEQELSLGMANLPALHCWSARAGEILTALDPEGGCWRLRLTTLGDDPHGVPFARLERPAESRLEIEVFQALPGKERFELVLQKLTELGVMRIVPVESRRSATVADRVAGQNKARRWPEVILRAAKQCRRARLPELYSACSFAEALELAGDAELRLMFFEREEKWTLADGLGRHRPVRVALLIGPEGGLVDEEVSAAREAGFLPVGLGPRILRTETASIVGAALLQGLLGDLC